MQFTSKLCGCAPKQIVTFNIPINFDELSNIVIIDECSEQYDNNILEWSYSLDNVCWSCYIKYNEILSNTVDIGQDFYLRIKIPGGISKISICSNDVLDYSIQLDSSFNFTYCSISNNSNMYNPYANMSCALDLNRQLSDLVCCMFGLPIIYFRLSPDDTSKDITFKEYTLMNVEPPKYIKMVVQDGQMPSSKPEFSDFGFDFSTDWETEIGKTMFATAFGNTAQPMEGDFIWVPMMKRMWQVTGSYEEKKDAFMWNATTFKVTLAKYEEKGSVNLGTLEDMVDGFVKNKYEDLFGDDNEDDAGTNQDTLESPSSTPNNLYPVFKEDATRKYVATEYMDISDVSTYYKGTVISDAWYTFDKMLEQRQIVYQKQYCGEEFTLCFIIKPLKLLNGEFSSTLFSLGNIKLKVKQTKKETVLYINDDLKTSLLPEESYFVWVRSSKLLNIIDMGAALYTYNKNIPVYKLQNAHYYYDIDHSSQNNTKWDIEFAVTEKSELTLYNFIGNITNIKLFNIYNDNLSEMLQQYPTNNNLLINDTARKLVGLDGVKIR